MSHASIAKIITGLCLVLSCSINAQETTLDVNSIKVTSTETQHGKQRGVFTKRSSTEKKSTGIQSFAKAAANGHEAKQSAAPLRRPLDRESRMSVVNSADFWIFDSFVSFDVDLDADGYYSTITVDFDVDTVYTHAEVYARLYLARGDVFEEIHTTSLFLIEGDSSEDTLFVESTFDTGFPSDDYEMLIEIYDGLNDQLVASSDGLTDDDLNLLTIESRSFEAEPADVIIVTESGGSFSYLMLLLIPVLFRRTFTDTNRRG